MKPVKYTLIFFSIIFSIVITSCNKSEDVFSESIRLPFDFTYYGVIPVGNGIKEIHDTLGITFKTLYFSTDGKLNKMIYEYRGSLIGSVDPPLPDTIIILDNIKYNSNNQLLSIGNLLVDDVYKFEYDSNKLFKAFDNLYLLFTGAPKIEISFTSNSLNQFTSSIYKQELNCPINKTYHYTQNKLDSISSINQPPCSSPLITTPTIQFFYTDNLITSTKVITNLASFNPYTTFIYSNGKLIEIKRPDPDNVQGAPHTTFSYY